MILFETGASGVYVEYITLALKRSGFLPQIKNTYDENVRNAVVGFQEKNNLEPDGIVGPDTYGELLPYIEGFRKVIASEEDTLTSLAVQYGISEAAVRTANPYINGSLKDSIVTIPLSFDVITFEVSYTSYLTEKLIGGLIARYPFLKSFSPGLSVMGKSISGITIGEGATEVFFNGAHHANEWITTPLLLRFAEDYAKAKAFESVIAGIPAQELFVEKTLYIIPLVNPDGVDLVTGSLSDSYYRDIVSEISSDYPAIPFPGGWKANITGTDLNLNYPADWLKARENKFALGYVSPAPRDYVGTAPLSAPESRAVYNFTMQHNFALTLSYHTQGDVIYWKYLDYEPDRSLEIGRELSRVSGYELSLTPSASGYAGYKDWFIMNYNKPGYTIEAGRGINPLPISQLGSIYSANFPLMATALKLA